MRTGFPTPPEPTLGAPNLFILNDLLQYICKCSLKEDELAIVAVDPGLYTLYSAGEAYPTNDYPFPAEVDELPNFSVCNNNNDHAAAKITHAILLKMRNDNDNMNVALINTLLSLIPMAFKLLYEQEQMMDLNAVFRQCFDWFVTKNGRTSAEDRETNRTAMAADWHPSMGLRYSPHASSAASPSRASWVIQSPTKTLLTSASVSSTAHDSSPRNTKHGSYEAMIPTMRFKSFWENAVQIAAFTSVPVSQHG